MKGTVVIDKCEDLKFGSYYIVRRKGGWFRSNAYLVNYINYWGFSVDHTPHKFFELKDARLAYEQFKNNRSIEVEVLD